MKLNKSYMPALIAFALFTAGYFPVFQLLFERWLISDEYSHAFLTLPIIFYMVWVKKTMLLESRPRYSFPGLLMVIFSTVFYLFSLQTNIFTLIAIAMVFTIVSVITYLFGFKSLSELFTPLILLILLIPAPIQLYAKITSPLQLKVSQATEWIVMVIGIPILREGNILNIPGKSFEVVEACSGLRSMITLVTLSIIIGYFMVRKNSSKLILLAASVPTAIFINIARVTTMVLLFYYYKLDVAEGTWHTMLGLLVFCIALFIFYLLQRVLRFWEIKEK